jgi:riboflavin kinase/FMN adenylyltransferase
MQRLGRNETLPSAWRGGAAAVGNFDGVHRGHVALLAELRQHALAAHGPALAVTFDPHPLQVLRPELHLPVLTQMADRAALLHECGADHVLVLPVTRELLDLTARQFFDQVILAQLAPRVLVEGPNFGFGRNREGTVERLRQWCPGTGLGLVVVPPLPWEGAPVSSSRIRDALLRGAIDEANQLLGRCYRLSGRVGTGQRRGQRLGFPTANLEQVATVIPGDGVYAVRVRHGGVGYAGAANVGPNPTFGEMARKVEIHLIGFQGDLYGQTLEADFVARLRDTRPFAGSGELTAQLRQDVEQARQVAGAKEGSTGP